MEPSAEPKRLRTTELADKLGISQPYASQLLNGHKPWPIELALRVRRDFGLKIGPIADTPDGDIPALERQHLAPSTLGTDFDARGHVQGEAA